jgi:hypothetical protein
LEEFDSRKSKIETVIITCVVSYVALCICSPCVIERRGCIVVLVCMNVTLACSMIFSRDSILRLSKSGAVCSRQSAFARMRMAFSSCLNIAVVLASGACIYVGAI